MLGGYVFLFSSYVAGRVSSSFRYYFLTDRMTGGTSQNQVINFVSGDDYPRKEVTCQEVEVFTDTNDDNSSISSPSSVRTSWLKANNIVDYVWEERFYTGQLLAVHRDGNYIAYGIKGKAKSQCHIRVMNCSTGRRALMRESEGAVEDLALAHTSSTTKGASLLLAAVDNQGSFLVYHIVEDDLDITCSLILHVIQDEPPEMPSPFKVFWCPYIPTEDAEFEEYVADMLAVARGTMIEVWHVGIVATDKNNRRIIKRSDGLSNVVKEGFVSIEAHTSRITEAAFSPDGTAIATASLDGTCKFYQVYMVSDEGGSRCLHKWRPHNGSPVTLLAFLDNHKSYSPDIQFWKYAVTGTNDNCELRLWSCETWQCLQTVKLLSMGGDHHQRFKVALDLSANFIIANCIDNKVMYVLELERTVNEVPYISAISELRLPYSVLSFGIVSANHISGPAKSSNNRIDVDPPMEKSVAIKMFIVQPKSLQNCDIVYPVNERTGVMPNVSLPNELALTNGDAKSSPGRLSPQASPRPKTPVLLTPAAFSSPSAAAIEATPPPTPPSTLIGGLTSGHSSPSREVQEILRITPEPTTMTAVAPSVPVVPPIPLPEMPAPIPEPLPPPPQCAITPQPIRSPATHQSVLLDRPVDSISRQHISSMEADLSSMKNDLATLLAIVKRQSAEIQELKLESANRMTDSEQLTAAMERAVTKSVTSFIPMAIDHSVAAHLPQLIKTNVASHLIPAVNEMKENFASDMSRHLAASDTKLRDAINKLVRCSPMVKQVGASIVEVGKPAMEQIIREALMEALPKVDQSCQNLFVQLSNSFSAGTAEYVSQVEKQVERSLAQGLADRTALAETVTKFEESISRFVDSNLQKLEACAEAITRGQQSRAVTPAVKLMDKVAVRERILAIANQGNFNSAFQEALSAGDLSLVTLLCEKVPVQRVFTGERCLLQQPVLLSLVQQLSADMSAHSTARHKYLEEAIISLDSTHAVTREHLPTVLGGLVKQLENYLAIHTGPLCTRVNVLLMATQVLLSRTSSPTRFH